MQTSPFSIALPIAIAINFLYIGQLSHGDAAHSKTETNKVEVKSGEIFSRIARRVFGAPTYETESSAVNQLKKLNPEIKNFDRLSPGQIINLGAPEQISEQVKEKRTPASVQESLPTNLSASSIEVSQNEAIFEPTRFSTSLGVTSLQYVETGSNKFSGTFLTPKIGYRQILPFASKWDFSANLYFNAFELSSNQSGVSFKTLGSNLRVGYKFYLPLSWSLLVAPGYYYSTTFVSGNSFGYKNMSGPQIFPVLSRAIGASGGKNIYLYFKYSPILMGTSLSFESNEKSIGTGYNFVFKNQRLNVSADYSVFTLSFKKINSVQIKSESLTFNLGVSW